MIDLTITSRTRTRPVDRRIGRMFGLTQQLEAVLAKVDKEDRFRIPKLAVWLDETEAPEETNLFVEDGEIDVGVGLHRELVEDDFTELQFVRSLRRLIEVALLRMPIPQEARLAIRDAVDRWAEEYEKQHKAIP